MILAKTLVNSPQDLWLRDSRKLLKSHEKIRTLFQLGTKAHKKSQAYKKCKEVGFSLQMIKVWYSSRYQNKKSILKKKVKSLLKQKYGPFHLLIWLQPL